MTTKKKQLLAAILSVVLIVALTLASCNRLTAPDDGSKASDSSQAGIVNIDPSASVDESIESSNDIEESNQEVPIDDVQSVTETSIDENVSAEVSEEQSEGSDDHEVSGTGDTSEASKDSAKNSPSTLTPIIEFGIGDGDYEVGFDRDDYDFSLAPSSFFIRNDELTVVDYVNARVLLYRDGKLVDKFEIKEQCELHRRISCVFDDDYYYILVETSGQLYVINRETNKSVEINIVATDKKIAIADYIFVCDGNDYYIKCDEHIYSEGYNTIIRTRYLKIKEKNVFEVTPKAEFLTAINFETQKLVTQQKEITLQKSSETVQINSARFSYAGKLGDAYIVREYHPSIEKDINGDSKFYYIFYKYNNSGELVGRYLWRMLMAINNGTGYLLGLDGEFYVICYDIDLKDKSNGKLGIYKVNFGMDEPLPEEKRVTTIDPSKKEQSTIVYTPASTTASQKGEEGHAPRIGKNVRYAERRDRMQHIHLIIPHITLISIK